jgi:hypothetical protein
MEDTKRTITAFVPWMVSDVCLYVLGFMSGLRVVQLVAFFALVLSIFFFALSYRLTNSGQKSPAKYGVRVSAWATIFSAALYLILSRWQP